ncbi:polyamine aminopropyltransferase [Xylanibacillus composti]|uniref:Polyamine aminopropyltransferase n=1 Tax=Xylanibacillus composti TaxID=1572762 RepID=A0A8J4H8M6_9BACL|nr:polyamine aminopropyltransferase [Xylanibacillus composti]MDT9726442.1 polyamine aminopropyltransferase [Xylanibacillus composti]GIQ71109.1 spermidine synthase [Xylanibacillus composti]
MERLPKYIQHAQGKLWLTEDERDNLKISYRIKEVLFEEKSPYQHVMVLDSWDFGPMLVLDGVVQTTSKDGHIYNEMISHVPLAMHPRPRKVLIIGGGDCGVAREAAKYDQVEQIDLVEIDEAVVRASKRYLPEVSGNLSDPRVRYHYTDGVEFVGQVQQEYDCIIVDSSDPVGPAEQLFETAFYRNLHRALKEDGIVVCQSQSPIFHSDVMRQSYERISRLFAETRLYTTVVPTYPGGLWSFTLGAKHALPDPDSIRFDKPARYANEEVLRGCFQLPAFLNEMLKQEPVHAGR